MGKFAVIKTDGNIGYIANGEPVGLPDCYAGAIPLAEESDPEPLTLSRRWACTNCGSVFTEGEDGKVATIEARCTDRLCRRGPELHYHTQEILCGTCADKWGREKNCRVQACGTHGSHSVCVAVHPTGHTCLS